VKDKRLFKRLILAAVIAVGISVVAFLVVGEGGFRFECTVPEVDTLPMYRYEYDQIEDISEATQLLRKHFPNFEISSRRVGRLNDTYVFTGSDGSQISINEVGIVTFSTEVEYYDARVPTGKELDIEALEETAKAYLRSFNIDTEGIFVQKVVGSRTSSGKTGPSFTFGWHVGGLPVIPLFLYNHVLISLDPEGNLAKFTYRRADFIPLKKEVSIMALEQCLTKAKTQIDRTVSDVVTEARLCYCGDGTTDWSNEGELVPCWWVTMDRAGEGSVKDLVIDATTGKHIFTFTHWK
jgi:hypothetical protein